ncbi:MAG: CDP-diacylglycerol--glycerol-3-phosphate 3-phosphatidyltransferase [Verrucomicrobiales bacterium]|jgi:CDP-diacylglycerol--glycerol-3-phosphate 3-phosphatidyltransferase
MNLPNQLTVARLFLTLVFVAVLSLEIPYKHTIALILFIIAAITDYLDGKIARERNLITNFGKLMDPLADKVLVSAAFVMLCADGYFPSWILVIILTREFLVTGLRLVASSQGVVLAADALGKWKTITQMLTAIYLLLFLAAKEPTMQFLAPIFQAPFMAPDQLGAVLIGLALMFTAISGWNYVWKNRNLIEWDA